MNSEQDRIQPLSFVLCLIFLLAMVMGSGPGLRLINPNPEDPGAVFTVLGIPKIYAWGLLWYVVQLAVILVANATVWTAGRRKNPNREIS